MCDCFVERVRSGTPSPTSSCLGFFLCMQPNPQGSKESFLRSIAFKEEPNAPGMVEAEWIHLESEVEYHLWRVSVQQVAEGTPALALAQSQSSDSWWGAGCSSPPPGDGASEKPPFRPPAGYDPDWNPLGRADGTLLALRRTMAVSEAPSSTTLAGSTSQCAICTFRSQ